MVGGVAGDTLDDLGLFVMAPSGAHAGCAWPLFWPLALGQSMVANASVSAERTMQRQARMCVKDKHCKSGCIVDRVFSCGWRGHAGRLWCHVVVWMFSCAGITQL